MSPIHLPRRIATLALTAVLAVCTIVACTRVEGSGRRQFVLYDDTSMNKLGVDAYQEVLTTEKKSGDAQAQAYIERVGKRLAAMAPDRGFHYEFTLIESDQVNAFCLPGGKVAVYTGILGYCENEAGLAAVLGHEIAHAIARHGAERMTQGVLIGGAQTALGAVLKDQGVSDTTTAVSLAAFGLGANVGVMLPFSRSHELEADQLGLTYMAKAGYEPQEAVKFWQRFATLGGGKGPAFMSTHPPSEQRAQALNGRMGEAQQLYAAAPEKRGAGEPVPAAYRR